MHIGHAANLKKKRNKKQAIKTSERVFFSIKTPIPPGKVGERRKK